jgi:hypothetical protein
LKFWTQEKIAIHLLSKTIFLSDIFDLVSAPIIALKVSLGRSIKFRDKVLIEVFVASNSVKLRCSDGAKASLISNLTRAHGLDVKALNTLTRLSETGKLTSVDWSSEKTF